MAMSKRTMARKILDVNGLCGSISPYIYCDDCPLRKECWYNDASRLDIVRKYVARPKYSPSTLTNIPGAH